MSNEDLTDFYDVIIDIDSFDDLKGNNKGWQIIMNENGEKQYEKFSDKNKKENFQLNRIGILGVSGVGKTYILGKITEHKKLKNIKIPTKGISVIYPQKENDFFVCIDSQGSEEPILDKKTDLKIINSWTEKERKENLKYFSKDKKFIDIFIQDFIIKKSNILIVVVDQLNFSEQKLINRLKEENFEKLFIIHNTQYFIDKATIEEHIHNVVEKSVFSNLQKNSFSEMDYNSNDKNDKPFYFIEKRIGEKNKAPSSDNKKVIHLFMGKEGTEAGNFYNNTQ